MNEEERKDYLASIAPPLDFSTHKGSSGRIGILGGSIEYTGAPFYSAMASLRLGADVRSLIYFASQQIDNVEQFKHSWRTY